MSFTFFGHRFYFLASPRQFTKFKWFLNYYLLQNRRMLWGVVVLLIALELFLLSCRVGIVREKRYGEEEACAAKGLQVAEELHKAKETGHGISGLDEAKVLVGYERSENLIADAGEVRQTQVQMKKRLRLAALACYILFLLIAFVFSRMGRAMIREFYVPTPGSYITANGFHETAVLISLLHMVFYWPAGLLVGMTRPQGKRWKGFIMLLGLVIGIAGIRYGLACGRVNAGDMIAEVVGAGMGIVTVCSLKDD